ncbi:MAG: YicC family protein [Betaproteobacteria bacterium]|nr:MAG: YicC family protein [Betaproteobacteria bacterium]
MIQSMTGFAAASADTPRGRLSVELRSVNARFLDLQFRIADELRAAEPLLRELMQARLARGKVDCRVFLADDASGIAGRLSVEAIARLRELSAQVLKEMPQAAPLRVGDVLRWPGVIVESPLDEEKTHRLAAEVCARALEELVASRSREGAKLAAALAERVAAMRRRVDEVAPLVPQSLATYQARLAERLREALGSADDDRVRAELAVFASKSDVDEELTRLNAHLAEVERTLQRGGAAGKRLDFLAQELNREANTLASKAASQELSDCALELKLLVEQMREQVQNIE